MVTRNYLAIVIVQYIASVEKKKTRFLFSCAQITLKTIFLVAKKRVKMISNTQTQIFFVICVFLSLGYLCEAGISEFFSPNFVLQCPSLTTNFVDNSQFVCLLVLQQKLKAL